MRLMRNDARCTAAFIPGMKKGIVRDIARVVYGISRFFSFIVA